MVAFRVLSRVRPHLTCVTLRATELGLPKLCLDGRCSPARIRSFPEASVDALLVNEADGSNDTRTYVLRTNSTRMVQQQALHIPHSDCARNSSAAGDSADNLKSHSDVRCRGC
jgi:hypothetical protein